IVCVHSHMFCNSKLIWTFSNAAELKDKIAVSIKLLHTTSTSIIYYQITIIVHYNGYRQLKFPVAVSLTSPLFYILARIIEYLNPVIFAIYYIQELNILVD